MAAFPFFRDDRNLTLDEMYTPRIEKKTNWRMVIYIPTGIVAISCLLIAAFLQLGIMSIGATNPTDFMVMGLLVFIGPFGVYENHRFNKVRSLEEKLPEFLRDVAESGKFGMTLAVSIRSAAKGRYGDLTPEIRRMAAQIGWGISATEALKLFSERVRTPLVKRTCGIIIKAANAGGNVADILTLVSNDIKERQLTRAEKELNMKAYMIVIYVAFFVFLATVLILNAVFIPQIQNAGGKGSGDSGGGLSGGATTVNANLIPQVRFIYLASALVHGLGDGVTAGILENGQIGNGLKHSFVMVLLAYLMLRFTLG